MTSSTIVQHNTQTWIAHIRDAVEAWRKQNGWSRETAADVIVEAHELAGMDVVSDIAFEPKTRDAYKRTRVNADRIFRWLDDLTKESTLLPTNFIPSILHALPRDLRMHLVNDLLRAHGMACRVTATDTDPTPITILLRSMMVETAQADQAVAALLDGVDEGELETAQREIAEAIAVLVRAQDRVEAMMRGGK
jgi:hypothetical protein